MLTGLLATLPRCMLTDGGGKPYCEGLLVKPIALVAPRIVSVKQAQPGPNLFLRKATASLSWCDNSGMAVHLSLRSTVVPFFGLDAMEQDPFTWSTDVIAIWQPDWESGSQRWPREPIHNKSTATQS